MLPESLTWSQSFSSGLSGGGGGGGGLTTMKSFVARAALSPDAKYPRIVPDFPVLSTTLISCWPAARVVEKIPLVPTVPAELPSSNTSEPRLQPRITLWSGFGGKGDGV